MTNEPRGPEKGEARETDPAGQPAGSGPAGDAGAQGQGIDGQAPGGQAADGQIAEGQEAAGQGTDAPVDPVAEAEAKVAELTNDLQRKHAEFVNFRKRTLRDIEDAKAKAKSSVLATMLDVLDDVDRAREHGDLEAGPLRAFTDKVANALSSQGLTAFGEVGDGFDPELHEAVQHSGDGDVPVVAAVLRRGYRVGDRVLRTAMVVVEDRPAGDTSQVQSGEESTQ